MNEIEKQSSVEVSRNAKGDYTFKIKLYFDEEQYTANQIAVITKGYMDEALNQFGIKGK